MRPGGGWGEAKEKESLELVENSFKEGDVDERLINRVIQLSGKYCSFS